MPTITSGLSSSIPSNSVVLIFLNLAKASSSTCFKYFSTVGANLALTRVSSLGLGRYTVPISVITLDTNLRPVLLTIRALPAFCTASYLTFDKPAVED